MARVRNKDAFEEARSQLLSVGERLIRARSYKGVGINDILKASGVPKGSFYHYFESKEAFGLEVARFYHAQQMQAARRLLRDAEAAPPLCALIGLVGCLAYLRFRRRSPDRHQSYQPVILRRHSELGEALDCQPVRKGAQHE